MGEDKSSSAPLLPMAVRQGISQAVSASQRRFFSSRLLLVLVAAALLYCLAVIANSSMSAPPQTVTANIGIEVIARDAASPVANEWQQPPQPPPTPGPTTETPFSPATTMKAETGPHHLHFRQPTKSVVVVRSGGDVQLDCRLKSEPHSIVTWYKDTDSFLTMGKRTYVDDSRISVHLEGGLNWALRIRNVKISDAGPYTCHRALASDGSITVELDVLPREDDSSLPPPPRALTKKLSDVYVPGFILSPDVCPNEGQDIDMIIALASHPLYVSSRDRVRNTWANLLNKKQVKVFGVGDISPAIGDKVKEEAEKNNDMVFGKFRDISIEPYTESVKRLALLSWMLEHCRFAKFMLMATHNEFVNAQLLQTLVKDLDPDVPAVYGLTDSNRTVVRDPNHPLYLSYSSFQSHELPAWATGPAFLLSRAAIGPLLQAALDSNAIPLHDIFLTSIASERANVTRMPMPQLFKAGQSVESCEFDKFAVGHSWGEPIDLKVSKMIDSGKHCSVPH